MDASFVDGDRLYFRGLTGKDVDGPYMGWLNDWKVTRHLMTGRFPESRESLETYVRAKEASPNDVLLAVILKEDDRHIGNVKIGPINWIHRFSEMGIIIGARDVWGKGYGSEAVRLATTYAFDRLNLNKLFLGFLACHAAARRCYEKAGYVQEGLVREYVWLDGQYHDNVLMGMTRSQWKLQSSGGDT